MENPYDRWKKYLANPATDISWLYLFFFQLYSDRFKKNYVMKIDRLCPFRITEECNAVGFLLKYFRTDIKNPGSVFQSPKGYQVQTWKLWNTQYIKEIDSNCALSGYTKKRDKNIFQYLIETQSEWIEFISRREPEWTVYKNKKLDDLIDYYSRLKID
jgi:hypothetical protein